MNWWRCSLQKINTRDVTVMNERCSSNLIVLKLQIKLQQHNLHQNECVIKYPIVSNLNSKLKQIPTAPATPDPSNQSDSI